MSRMAAESIRRRLQPTDSILLESVVARSRWPEAPRHAIHPLRHRCPDLARPPRRPALVRRGRHVRPDRHAGTAAIAVPGTDVAAAVDYARERGLRVAPQRTGHNAKPLDDLGDTLLLRTDALLV